MIVRTIRRVLSCALLVFITVASAAQEPQANKAPAPSSNVPSGAELYKKHCEPCHGTDLKGAGPFPAPYRTPPDLSTLSKRHGGKFPDAYVAKVLQTGVTMPAHGPAEMPVWGAEFAATDRSDKAQVALRIKNLANYLKSLQAK